MSAVLTLHEGYPGNRFHGGGQFVDVVEQTAIDRAKELFNAKYANTFRFQTDEKNWDKNEPLFKEIYSTIKFLKKKEM